MLEGVIAVAQFFNDFSDYTEGIAPFDWTPQFGTEVGVNWRIMSEQLRATVDTANTQFTFKSLAWDAVTSSGDIEVLFRGRYSGIIGDLYVGAGINGFFGGIGLNRQAILLRAAASTSIRASNPSRQFNSLDWHYIRFRKEGKIYKLKIWLETEQEPSVWDIEYDASGETEPGVFVGVGTHLTFQDRAWVYWDDFGVGTDGDPAPTGPILPPEPGLVQATAANATVIMHDNANIYGEAICQFTPINASLSHNTPDVVLEITLVAPSANASAETGFFNRVSAGFVTTHQSANANLAALLPFVQSEVNVEAPQANTEASSDQHSIRANTNIQSSIANAELSMTIPGLNIGPVIYHSSLNINAIANTPIVMASIQIPHVAADANASLAPPLLDIGDMGLVRPPSLNVNASVGQASLVSEVLIIARNANIVASVDDHTIYIGDFVLIQPTSANANVIAQTPTQLANSIIYSISANINVAHINPSLTAASIIDALVANARASARLASALAGDVIVSGIANMLTSLIAPGIEANVLITVSTADARVTHAPSTITGDALVEQVAAYISVAANESIIEADAILIHTAANLLASALDHRALVGTFELPPSLNAFAIMEAPRIDSEVHVFAQVANSVSMLEAPNVAVILTAVSQVANANASANAPSLYSSARIPAQVAGVDLFMQLPFIFAGGSRRRVHRINEVGGIPPANSVKLLTGFRGTVTSVSTSS